MALTTPVATRPVQQQADPPTPATQVAQALVEPIKVVLTSPSPADAAAPHVTTIQITPVELGRVDIRIERTTDGTAKIELVAERPETLSRLMHDQSHLHEALDQAGLVANGRTIEFSLAPAATNDAPIASGLSGQGDSLGQGTTGQGSQRQGGRYPNQGTALSEEIAAKSSATSYSLRNGIDITA